VRDAYTSAISENGRASENDVDVSGARTLGPARIRARRLELVDGTRNERAPVARVLKRAVDIAGSILLIALLLPVAILIMVAIVVDSPGPVMFVQRRVGRNGRMFSLMKFRTMVPDSDTALAQALASDDALDTEWRKSRKLRRDPRITRVGHLLRRLSADELPQILNVLVGNMSLVGPRPVIEDELRYFGKRADDVLSVRPGLTGLWAVSGRSDVSYDERVELEHRYATGWTVVGDFVILLRTIPAVMRGHGAY